MPQSSPVQLLRCGELHGGPTQPKLSSTLFNPLQLPPNTLTQKISPQIIIAKDQLDQRRENPGALIVTV